MPARCKPVDCESCHPAVDPGDFPPAWIAPRTAVTVLSGFKSYRRRCAEDTARPYNSRDNAQYDISLVMPNGNGERWLKTKIVPLTRRVGQST